VERKEIRLLTGLCIETIAPSVCTISSLFIDSQVDDKTANSAVEYRMRIRLTHEMLLAASIS
jgi:hypothetical protein